MRDQRTLLVACEKENTALQTTLHVKTVQTASQTESKSDSSSVKTEIDSSLAQRAVLEQTVTDLRRQLQQFEVDPQRFSARQRVLQLEQERAAAQEQSLQISQEHEAHVQQLTTQHRQQQQALREAMDARADLELKNAMLHELVKQLEISKARLETEKRAVTERYSSLRTVMVAVEERAVQAEHQHQLLLQKISTELQAIRVQSP